MFSHQKPSQVDKKATFLRYTQNGGQSTLCLDPMHAAGKGLKPRQVLPGKLSLVDQLKLKLLKSLDPSSIKQALDELFELKAYDVISRALKEKNANLSFFKYLINNALRDKNYNLAIRLVKDLKKPIVYKTIIEAIVYNQDYQALESAVKSIEAYIRYYHRLSVVEANTYKQHVYAFAAMAAVKHKAYTYAFSWAKQMGRCSYVWVDLVTIIAQNQDFWEVERFAESAEHLREAAYKAALSYCQEGSPWAEVFLNKSSKTALVL